MTDTHRLVCTGFKLQTVCFCTDGHTVHWFNLPCVCLVSMRTDCMQESLLHINNTTHACTCMAADPVQQLKLESVAENINQDFDDICAKYHACQPGSQPAMWLTDLSLSTKSTFSCMHYDRYVSDLSVGSMALQDPASSPHGTHMTFSARQELSGWQAPTGAGEQEGRGGSIPGIRPRFFVVFEDGSGYEILDKDLFAAYAQRKV